MKILVVEPMQPCRVQEIPDTLEAMQKIVGGYIESFSFEKEAIICNEEGKSKCIKEPHNVRARTWTGFPPLYCALRCE